jgi:hypothetical protein
LPVEDETIPYLYSTFRIGSKNKDRVHLETRVIVLSGHQLAQALILGAANDQASAAALQKLRSINRHGCTYASDYQNRSGKAVGWKLVLGGKRYSRPFVSEAVPAIRGVAWSAIRLVATGPKHVLAHPPRSPPPAVVVLPDG